MPRTRRCGRAAWRWLVPFAGPLIRHVAALECRVGATEGGDARGLRTLAVYFGLAEDPAGRTFGRSRYGQTSARLDRDIDELRARIAELERRLGQHSVRS